MDELSRQVAEALEEFGFEVQRTSFDDFTAEGETNYLRTIPALPSCDSWRILHNFPQFFVVHHSAAPNCGIFFAKIAAGSEASSKDAEEIHQKYIPSDLLVISQDAKKRLVARWHNSSAPPCPLSEIIGSRLAQ